MKLIKQMTLLKCAAAVVGCLTVASVALLLSSNSVDAGVRIIKLSDKERVGKLTVVLGRSDTIRVSMPFSEIVVGDPETADVNALTNKTLYVLGRKLGTTNVTLFDDNKKLIAVIDVEVTHNLDGMKQALRETLPNASIRIRSLDGRVVLEGHVANSVAAERAMSIARDFAGDQVTNSLNIEANQQVNLEVRMVEVNRLAGKELGINWNVSNGNGTRFETGSGVNGALAPVVGALSGAIPFGTILSHVLGAGTSPDLLISALEQKNLARRLAEPNLTTLSGQKASFHAGGEVPIQTCTGTGVTAACGVTYKEFGVELEFTPLVLDNGLINLNISPEVSEIDASNTINGNFAFTSRKANTAVELRNGQSFAIAGLLQTVNAKTISQVPLLGNVPILGALFRSSSFQKKESDLVIIVTPRLAVPVGNVQELHDPLQNPVSSNEPEFFLLGKEEVSKNDLDVHYKGKYGHIIDIPKVNNGIVSK